MQFYYAMAITFGANILSLRAQRNLADANNSVSRSFERLSSGTRMNRPSDDAAGIAMASSLRAYNRIYTQSIRNLNDGVSAVNISDSASEQLGSVIGRLRELATQSANGAFSQTQRISLNAEAQQLRLEYNRIVGSTRFNGISLLDSATGSIRLQGGNTSDTSALYLNSSNLGTGNVGTGSFQSGVSFSTPGFAPTNVISADVNIDGFADIITLDTTNNAIGIQLGNGDGSFQAATSISTGNQPGGITAADLNNDGNLDLVVSEYGGGAGTTVGIFLNNGNGTFAARKSYGVGTGPIGVASGDFNRDGKIDVIVSNFNSGNASVLLGRGDGTLGTAANFSLSATATQLAVGDLDGDGKLDAAFVESATPAVRILYGKGDGTFDTSVSLAMRSFMGASSIAIGSIRGNGILDIVATSGTTGYAEVFLGNGDRTFQARQDYTLSATAPGSVNLSDLNGDGILDIISADTGVAANSISVLLGNSDGTFQARISYDVGRRVSALALGDFDGNGVSDIVATSSSTNTTNVLLGNGRSVSTLNSLDLTTRSGALAAMRSLTTAADNLSLSRGKMGSEQARLETALSNLLSTRDHYASALANISDIDVASEVASLTRNQILQNISSALLAQTNIDTQIGLQLLE